MNTKRNDPLVNLFHDKSGKRLLSVYLTAGFPGVSDTVTDIQALYRSGVDFIEIGMPFSDPLADGPVIQEASQQALQNGMNLELLFEQLSAFKGIMPVPALLMGYLNPVLQFGVEAFCRKATEVGISGVILPDLPLREYLQTYRDVFKQYGLHFIFLITPTTPRERILEIDKISTSFIYVVGSSTTTGSSKSDPDREAYLKQLSSMQLRSPLVVGFGISNAESLRLAWKYAKGAITGTAYIQNRKRHADAFVAVSELLQQLGLPATPASENKQIRETDQSEKMPSSKSLTSKLFIP